MYVNYHNFLDLIDVQSSDLVVHYLDVSTLNHALLLLGFCWVVWFHDTPPPAFPMSTGCVSHHLVNFGILQVVENPCFPCLKSQEYDSIQLFASIVQRLRCGVIQWYHPERTELWEPIPVGWNHDGHEATLEANLRRHEKMMEVHLHYFINLRCSCSLRFQHTCWKHQQGPKFDDHSDFWMKHILYMAHYRSKTFFDELQHVR